MKRSLFLSAFVLLFLCLWYSCSDSLLVLNHVTVIDGTGAGPQPNRIVLIRKGRILEIDAAREINFPEDATVIDARGKFLIPGLWDMHIHWDHKRYLPLFIANGVTNARVMAREWYHEQWRKQIQYGWLIGPRLLIGTPLVDGKPPVWAGSSVVQNAAEAIQMVDAEKASGADFIKVYSRLSRNAYLAIAKESKRQNIPFEGHVPYSVSILEASLAGQKSVEHLYGVLLACSSKEEELRKKILDDIADDWNISRAQAKELLATYDQRKAESVFADLARKGTWQCPTLTLLRTFAYYSDPAFRNDPRLKYMPSRIREDWEPTNNTHLKPQTPDDEGNFRRLFAKEMEIVGAMNRAGVRFIAGTDAYNPFCFPGFSMHDELDLLVKAGLSTMEALQAATRNAAEFAGKLDSLGTIEKGKIADLVLLDADPLHDISNTQKISAVIYGGRIFQQKELQAMLADAEDRASKPSIADVILKTIKGKDTSTAVKQYRQLKTTEPDTYEFDESELKSLESQLWRMKDFDSAIAVLELNAEVDPKSYTFDRLAGAYLSKGDKEAAIKYYKKSLELNPNNWNAKEKLKKLQSE